MKYDTIQLISQTSAKNAYGVEVKTETRQQAFCTVKSITQTEFFSAKQSGLKPQKVFVIFAPEYKGQKLLEYNGAVYSIYRTYAPDNASLELYAEERAGD